VVAVALLGLAAADLVLSAITPVTADVSIGDTGTATRTIDTDPTVLMRRNPFEGAPEATEALVTAALPVTTLQLKLRGSNFMVGDVPSALIETPDSRQRRFLLGEEIIRGVTLEEVRQRAVVISRNGRLEVLPLKSFPVADEEMQLGRRQPAEGDADPEEERLADQQLQDEAETQAEEVRGETIEQLAGYFFPLLAQQGAEPTDIPVAVNGRTLTETEGWDAVLAAIRQEGRAVLTVVRNGERRDITITVPSGISF
jgi:type II secretion system protein C